MQRDYYVIRDTHFLIDQHYRRNNPGTWEKISKDTYKKRCPVYLNIDTGKVVTEQEAHEDPRNHVWTKTSNYQKRKKIYHYFNKTSGQEVFEKQEIARAIEDEVNYEKVCSLDLLINSYRKKKQLPVTGYICSRKPKELALQEIPSSIHPLSTNPRQSISLESASTKPLQSVSSEHGSTKPLQSVSSEHGSTKPLQSVSSEHASTKPLQSVSSEHGSTKPLQSVSSEHASTKPLQSTSSESVSTKPLQSTSSESVSTNPLKLASFHSQAAPINPPKSLSFYPFNPLKSLSSRYLTPEPLTVPAQPLQTLYRKSFSNSFAINQLLANAPSTQNNLAVANPEQNEAPKNKKRVLVLQQNTLEDSIKNSKIPFTDFNNASKISSNNLKLEIGNPQIMENSPKDTFENQVIENINNYADISTDAYNETDLSPTAYNEPVYINIHTEAVVTQEMAKKDPDAHAWMPKNMFRACKNQSRSFNKYGKKVSLDTMQDPTNYITVNYLTLLLNYYKKENNLPVTGYIPRQKPKTIFHKVLDCPSSLKLESECNETNNARKKLKTTSTPADQCDSVLNSASSPKLTHPPMQSENECNNTDAKTIPYDSTEVTSKENEPKFLIEPLNSQMDYLSNIDNAPKKGAVNFDILGIEHSGIGLEHSKQSSGKAPLVAEVGFFSKLKEMFCCKKNERPSYRGDNIFS